jgi:hypothetical protein
MSYIRAIQLYTGRTSLKYEAKPLFKLHQEPG